MKGKGRNSDSLHIDRKKEELGYVPGNLQVLTNRENVQKYLTYDFDQKGKPINFKTHVKKNEPEENYPF